MKADHYGLRDDVFRVAVTLQRFKAMGIKSQAVAVRREESGFFVPNWGVPNGVALELDDDVLKYARALETVRQPSISQVDALFDGRGNLKILKYQRSISI